MIAPMLFALLDDDPRRMEAFVREIRARFAGAEIVSFDQAPAMIAWLPEGLARATLVSLDHDLGPSRESADGGRFEPGTGRDVADAIAAHPPSCPVVIHSSNGPAAQGMFFALEAAGWTVARAYPMNDVEWIAEQWSAELERLAMRR